MLNTKKKSSRRSRESFVKFGVIAAVVAVGGVLLYSTRAATPYVTTEPELGTLSRGAVTVTDTTASGGKSTKFAVPVTAPAPTPPPPSPTPTPPTGTTGAAAWITAYFKGVTPKTGVATGRKDVETPAFFKDYTASGGKYMINARETAAPNDERIGIINGKFTNSSSTDIYGAALYNSKTASGAGTKWYLKNVLVEPNWPKWVSYSATNYDGITLDNDATSGTEMYAEDLTVRRWNADAGIDNKTQKSQFVRLTIEGAGHRSFRVWRPGPHYLVDSRIDNPGGSGDGAIIWMSNCSTVVLRVWNSTFNGSKTVPANKIKCDSGSSPTITYLTKDPRTTGEMHPMFK